MCYKEEKYDRMAANLFRKMADMPPFIRDFFRKYKSVATMNCNYGYIRDLLLWLCENKYIKKSSISEITPEDMDAIKNSDVIAYCSELRYGLNGKKNSINSLVTKKNVFSAFWEYMVANDYVRKNIMRHDSSSIFKEDRVDHEVKIPDAENFSKFYEAACNDPDDYIAARNKMAICLMLSSGIRLGEMSNMDIKDVHTESNKPYIMVLRKGNSHKYSRVDISQNCAKALDSYIAVRKNNASDENDPLFVSKKKSRWSEPAIRNMFDVKSDSHINPHMLRHIAGTAMYSTTKDLLKTQKQLGHSNPNTTARYYVNMDEDLVNDAVLCMKIAHAM